MTAHRFSIRSGEATMMRGAALLLVTALAWTASARANGFAHSPEYIRRANQRAFQGAKPEEIARYLAHFSGGVADGAVLALAEGGEKNLPLIQKLLKDTNPWIRGGAVRVLAAMYGPSGEDQKKGAPPEMTPKLQEIMGVVSGMLEDPHPEVQASLGGFFRTVRIENDLVRKVLIAQASDVDARVRARTAESIRHWIKDPATRVRIGMEVLRRPEGVQPHALSLSSRYLWEQKDQARHTIPVVVKFLNDRAHTVRGFFTNGPYQRGLDLIEYHFDEKLEKSPGLVQAVCRSVVRIPYSTYGGWMDARKTAVRILEKLAPSSASAVLAAADEEARWLEACTDDEIKAVTPTDTKEMTSRESAVKRVKYLRVFAAWLAAGKPAASKPEFQHPQKKPSRKKPPKKKPAGPLPLPKDRLRLEDLES